MMCAELLTVCSSVYLNIYLVNINACLGGARQRRVYALLRSFINWCPAGRRARPAVFNVADAINVPVVHVSDIGF